ncbi:type IV pilin protein [Humidesulfovibrio idahonensis]
MRAIGTSAVNTAAPGTQPSGTRRGAAGFTLMEVIAVVIILAILAAVVVPRYLEFVGKATESVAQSVASEGLTRFKNAYTQYLLDTGKKPSSLTDLTPAAYLNLDGDGKVNVGGYDLAYTASSSALTVSSYTANATTPLASATMPWP